MFRKDSFLYLVVFHGQVEMDIEFEGLSDHIKVYDS